MEDCLLSPGTQTHPSLLIPRTKSQRSLPSTERGPLTWPQHLPLRESYTSPIGRKDQEGEEPELPEEERSERGQMKRLMIEQIFGEV